jgi:hypothetical protein
MNMESADAAKHERPQNQDGPYVIKRLALWQRLLNALIPASIAAFLAYQLAFSQNTNTTATGYFFVLALIGGPGYLAWYLWNKKDISVLATVPVPHSRLNKFIGYVMFFLGVLVPGLMVALGPVEGKTFAAALIALMVLVGAGVLLLQPVHELTDAARNELKNTHNTPSPEKLGASDDSGEGFLESIGEFIKVIVILALIAAVLVVPFFFAPWWAVVIIWLLIFIIFK